MNIFDFSYYKFLPIIFKCIKLNKISKKEKCIEIKTLQDFGLIYSPNEIYKGDAYRLGSLGLLIIIMIILLLDYF